MSALARTLTPALLAALAGVWLAQRAAPKPTVEGPALARAGFYLFVPWQGPDPSAELIRELARIADTRRLPVRVHVLAGDPPGRAQGDQVLGGAPARSRALPWHTRVRALLETLGPLVGDGGIAPADPYGVRLAASFGITALPAVVYVAPDGTAHVREGAAPGAAALLECRESP